jgi:hypothetical protein
MAPSPQPFSLPSNQPSCQPTTQPTRSPFQKPSSQPTLQPLSKPSSDPTRQPTFQPSRQPLTFPSAQPSTQPTAEPSRPTSQPSKQPSSQPTRQPITCPSRQPTSRPSGHPTSSPTFKPQDAPLIDEIRISTSATSITFNLTYSGNGNAICAAFVPGFVPWSTENIENSGAIGIKKNFAYNIVTLPGLLPATNYDTYCMTISELGIKLRYWMVIETKTRVTTSCCKEINVRLASSVIREDTIIPNILSLSFASSAVLSNLILLLDLNCGSGKRSNLLFPNKIFIPIGKTVDTIFVSFAGSSPLFCNLDFSIQHDSQSEFSFFYETGMSISIVPSSSLVVRPTISSAIFSDSGEYVIVRFSNPTDKAGLSDAFNCSAIFVSTKLMAYCYWETDSIVKLFSPTIAPLDEITLKLNVVANACQQNFCPKSLHDSFQNPITVFPPAVPAIPRVFVCSSSYLPIFEDFLLDFSMSSGSFSRPWSNISISVVSPNIDVSKFQGFVDGSIKTLPFAPIPSSFFVAGEKYAFIVKLCNFLGYCGIAQHYLTVSRDKSSPDLAILGPKAISITASESLLLQTYSSVGSRTKLVYNWEIKVRGASFDPELGYLWTTHSRSKSSARDPTLLFLPPFSLDFNKFYKIVCTVVNPISSLSAHDEVYITVVKGKIFARLVGGTERTLALESSLILNASSSYDEDTPKRDAAGLYFAWNFTQVYPTLSRNCFISFGFLNSKKSVVKLTALRAPSALNSMCYATVTVSDIFRSSIATVAIKLISPTQVSVSVTDIELKDTPLKLVINPLQELKLLGMVITNAPQRAWWGISDQNVNLSSIGLSPTSQNLYTQGIRQFYLSLDIPTHRLKARSSYVFTLYCTTESGTTPASLSINVVVNGPPLPGKFIVSPYYGIAVDTPFTFYTEQWFDENLPLSYAFGYISGENKKIILRSKSPKALGISLLPEGKSGFLLKCFVSSFDALGAKSYLFFQVNVTKVPITTKEILLYQKSIIGNTLDSDVLRQSVAISIAATHPLSCSLAPNCSKLNRNKCEFTSNTCSSCVSNMFVGSPDDSNDPCVPIINLRHPVTRSCTKSIHCHSWEFCGSNNVCTLAQKSCPLNCSGLGSCSFVNLITGDLLSDCPISSSSCVAKCNCYVGYGGLDCSSSIDNYLMKQFIQSNAAGILLNLTKLEPFSLPAVDSWVSSFLLLTSDPSEISVETSRTLNAIALSILSSSSQDVPYSVLTSLDHLAQAVVYNRYERRRLTSVFYPVLDQSFIISDEYADIFKNVQIFCARVLRDLVVGTPENTVILNVFRGYFHALTAYDMQNILQVTKPQTELERLIGERPPQVIFPSYTAQSESVVKISVIFFPPRLIYYPVLISEVVYFNFYCSDLLLYRKLSNVTVIFPIIQPYTMNNVSAKADRSVKTRCLFGVIKTITVKCDQGYNLTVHCNGTSGVMTSYCPFAYEVPKCAIVGADDKYFKDCSVTALGEENITCLCRLHSINPHQISGTIFAFKTRAYSLVNSTWLPSTEQPILISSKVNMVLGFVFTVTLISLFFSNGYVKAKFKKEMKFDVHLFNSLRKGKTGLLSVIGRHHRFFSIWGYKNGSYPPIVNVISLGFTMLLGLFLQAYIYTVRQSLNYTCGDILSMETCLSFRSFNNFGDHVCSWDNVKLRCFPYQEAFSLNPKISCYIIALTTIFSQVLGSVAHHLILLLFVRNPNKINLVHPDILESEERVDDKNEGYDNSIPRAIEILDTEFREAELVSPSSPLHSQKISVVSSRISPTSNNVVMTFEENKDEVQNNLESVRNRILK